MDSHSMFAFQSIVKISTSIHQLEKNSKLRASNLRRASPLLDLWMTLSASKQLYSQSAIIPSDWMSHVRSMPLRWALYLISIMRLSSISPFGILLYLLYRPLWQAVFESVSFGGSYFRKATRSPVQFVTALSKAWNICLMDSNTVWVDIGILW